MGEQSTTPKGGTGKANLKPPQAQRNTRALRQPALQPRQVDLSDMPQAEGKEGGAWHASTTLGGDQSDLPSFDDNEYLCGAGFYLCSEDPRLPCLSLV